MIKPQKHYDYSNSKFPNYRQEIEDSYLRNPKPDPTTVFALFDIDEPYSLNIACEIFGKEKIESYASKEDRQSMLMVPIPLEKAALALSRISGFENVAKYHADDEIAVLMVSGEIAEWISMPIPIPKS
jgi:hypothetical protein